MAKHSHTKARIEKKISITAKGLLLALWPHFKEEDCANEGGFFESYHGTVYHDEWVVWFGPDYWGESDYQDCWWLLYSWLIDSTTDFDGIMKAQEETGWSVPIDETPFYSPWRGASRAVIISHCRDLVRAGVTLERMR